ncbi:PAXNEB protein-domain-containing protein [Melanogaster broomeanus]|nr:PAXNEB protein-domain-containing protein [Melanogaster broomeanus]
MSLKIPMPTAADLNRMTYKGAAKLREEMTRPGGQPEKLDFGTMPVCSNCDAPIMTEAIGMLWMQVRHLLLQETNWKVGRYGTENHKFFCEKNKFQKSKRFSSFSLGENWSRMALSPNLTYVLIMVFSEPKALDTGAYRVALLPISLSQTPEVPDDADGCGPFRVGPVEGYQDGYLLLLDQYLDEKAGWKLEERLIPKLCFEPSSEPMIASSANVVDWKSWYQWRGLSLESPAALLMHYPLTKLNIHYLGPEAELNMLPLFSELALLLPYTDIRLTFFGFAVHNIVQQARKKSIAAKAKRNEPVYAYTSPATMGGSTLSIYLHGEHENWDPRFMSTSDDIPDAIVALNAGLLSYKAWAYVIIFCHMENKPFGVTEYAEQSAEVQTDSFPKMIHNVMPSFGAHLGTAELENLVTPRQYLIEFNPFQQPGQRSLGSIRLPNVSNGFTIRVIGRDAEEAKEVTVPSGIPSVSNEGLMDDYIATVPPLLVFVYAVTATCSTINLLLRPYLIKNMSSFKRRVPSKQAEGYLSHVRLYFLHRITILPTVNWWKNTLSLKALHAVKECASLHDDALSFAKECMWMPSSSSNTPTPTPPVNNDDDDDDESATQSEEKIKIAWRYEQMGRFQTTVTSSNLSTDDFCNTFDLTTRIPSLVIDDARNAKRLLLLNLNANCDVASSITGIIKQIQDVLASTSPTEVVRLCIPSLGSPEWEEQSPTDILHFLHSLAPLAASASACLCLCPGWVQKVGWVTDAAISMAGFGANPSLVALFPSHHGLLQIHKLPAPHSILPASDKYSTLRGLSSSAGASVGSGENNLAFKCMRKRLLFETMHLDLEGGVTERRTTPSSNAISLDAGIAHTHEVLDVADKGRSLATVEVELEQPVEIKVGLSSALSQSVGDIAITPSKPRKPKKRVAFHSDKPDLYDF